jgi:hypothetical protein
MSDQTQEFEIRFEELTPAEAGTKAGKLSRELNQISPDVSVSLKKDDITNQDFGATLVLMLGTPAIIAIANGIASYLKRNHGKITIYEDGKVIASGISGDDAARIAEAFSKRYR